MTAVTKTRWWAPLVCLGLGLALFAALWAGGEEASAWFSLAVLSGVGLLLLVGGRFDIVRGLRGDGRDEYWAGLDLRATALAGGVLNGVVIAMCLWEFAHGRDGVPYIQLALISGVSYVVALAVLRWRG